MENWKPNKKCVKYYEWVDYDSFIESMDCILWKDSSVNPHFWVVECLNYKRTQRIVEIIPFAVAIKMLELVEVVKNRNKGKKD